MTHLDEIGTPVLGYARESYAREKHPDNPDLIELRRQGFDRLIAAERAKAWDIGRTAGINACNAGFIPVDAPDLNPYRTATS